MGVQTDLFITQREHHIINLISAQPSLNFDHVLVSETELAKYTETPLNRS